MSTALSLPCPFRAAEADTPLLLDVSLSIIKDVAVIKIPSFHINTYEQTEAVLVELHENELRDERNTSMVLDLRGNFGGLLEAAISTAELFVPEGLICTVHIDGLPPVEYRAPGTEYDKRLIVLVNAFTASGAEILASAIKESGGGILVGTSTYGKATVQRVRVDVDGNISKDQAGYYLTRDGNDISVVGLKPDIEVLSGDGDMDLQLEKAVEVAVNQLFDEPEVESTESE